VARRAAARIGLLAARWYRNLFCGHCRWDR